MLVFLFSPEGKREFLREGNELLGTQKEASEGPLLISSPTSCPFVLLDSPRSAGTNACCLSASGCCRCFLPRCLEASLRLPLSGVFVCGPCGPQSSASPPFLPGLAAPSLSAGAGRLGEGSGLRCHGHIEAGRSWPGQLLLGLRMGGQSQAALAAPEPEPQSPETGGTATQENLELEVRGRKPEPNREGRRGTAAGPSPLREGPGGPGWRCGGRRGVQPSPRGGEEGKDGEQSWGRGVADGLGLGCFQGEFWDPRALTPEGRFASTFGIGAPVPLVCPLVFPSHFSPLLFSSPRFLPFNPYASVFLFSHLWVPASSFPLGVSAPLLRRRYSSLSSSLSIPPTLSCLHSSSLACPALLPKLWSSHLLLSALCLHSPFLSPISSSPLPQPSLSPALRALLPRPRLSPSPRLPTAELCPIFLPVLHPLFLLLSGLSFPSGLGGIKACLTLRAFSTPSPCPPTPPRILSPAADPACLSQRQLPLPGRGQQLVWRAHPLSHWSCWASL